MNDAIAGPTPRKLGADDYFRMIDTGILGKEDRVELIDGAIIDKAPISQGHAATASALTHALVMACLDRALVGPNNSIRLDRLNVPEPDFAVFRHRPDFYATGDRPGPADVLLLVEVADSSLRYDRTVKLPLYARAGIPEVWIVDLKRRVLHAHRRPMDGEYAEITTHHPDDHLALAAAPDITVRLDLALA